MDNKKLNILPVPTFGWLKVNYEERENENDNERRVTKLNCSDGEKTRLEINESAAQRYELEVKGGQSVEVIEFITAKRADTQTAIKLESGARARLIQVITGTERTINNVRAFLSDGAELEYISLNIGGEDTLSDINARLDGRGARFEADIGYKVSNEGKLDINLLAEHFGKRTETRINASGVLSEKADKTFKGTIDFKNGAVGAKGKEKEDVLLLDETVRNRTVPLILCAEEDVEGSHGASIGRIDERQLFYMRSRGLDEQTIYKLAARARLDMVIRRIDDEQTNARIRQILGGNDDE
ncbi:MAG: SufD family Fe-S cluster assembly protein [Ruminococcus sp.]|nr:SufD family Fe-S cluster assembly protein [Ruminococcus sp.]